MRESWRIEIGNWEIGDWEIAINHSHHYASACVAALSQLILDEGKEFCTLFTDLANPTSNHIYQQIGYRPVCDFAEFHLHIQTNR